jgi:hypothetical protein
MADTPLHNIFLRSLHMPRRELAHLPDYRGRLRDYRRRLIEADRFSLDADAVWETTDRADYDRKHVMDRVHLARLPYPEIWLEYSQREKVTANFYAGRGPRPGDGVPELVGFLIRRVDERPDAWIATKVIHQSDNIPVNDASHGLCFFEYMFDAESNRPIRHLGSRMSVAAGPPHWLRFGSNVTPEVTSKLLLGVPTGDPEYDPLDEAANKVAVSLEPLWRSKMDAEVKAKPSRAKALGEMLSYDLEEIRGEVRFLITALALINEVPILVTDTAPPRRSFLTQGGMRPYLSHRTISLNVPAIKKAKKSPYEFLHEATRRKRHKVRAHTRRFYAPSGALMYEKWIKEHLRGDERLGWVTHDYQIKSPDGRRTRERLRAEEPK